MVKIKRCILGAWMAELFPMIWQIKGRSLGRGDIDQERSRQASESQILVLGTSTSLD